MHDPRYDAGYGVAYEVEPTPGRHTIASYTYTDLMALHKKTRQAKRSAMLHSFKERFGVGGKGKPQSLTSCYVELINGLGLCLFGISVGGNPPVAEWINATTGWNQTFDDYLQIGRRIKTLRQAFNAREGITPESTMMPQRARGVPAMNEGPLKDITPDFDGLAKEYYREMGWDYETGRPLPATLDMLGLGQVKAELYGE